ncbi:aldehyde dehydrogenase (NAD+) [Saonia flava]|uniref:Aldehyde dehydrogenase n=1 Tax=Saonia flava TaxID=523696 RepID=A0A846QV20_9FLAO|nr:aldehyde dehydrogenase family protein [Saonia flava]NJB70790.1 aldehyde dehydrogenase (NAD+) [Saonia flava]
MKTDSPKIKNPYQDLFDLQKENQYNVANTAYKERKAKLNALKYALEKTYRSKLQKAMYDDFKKPILETDLTEIYQVVGEIKYAKKHLKEWMWNQYAKTPITLLGSSSWVKYEPKGVCLIISPWNFPINLTFGPLVSAIAAGNTIILKPSEMTSHTSSVMGEIIEELFPNNEVALVEGGANVSKELLELPFNHIFFTGSPSIGKLIMKSAAEHLTSVTLELGGKSPTIVDKTANLKMAAQRIVWGAFLNNGQTCVAPDYVLVHENRKEKLVEEIKKQLEKFYSNNPSTSESYSRIVNKHHFNRLVNYIENAKETGGIIEIGGDFNEKDNYLAPTIISNLPNNAKLLQEEIFGPILPIVTYKTIDEAIQYVNSHERPLALYIFSTNRKTMNHILTHTRAGSTGINNSVLQFTNHNLPFGGVNTSGIGKSHGFYGFQEFSNIRSVLKQHTIGPTSFLFPPYNKLKQKLANITIKWL